MRLPGKSTVGDNQAGWGRDGKAETAAAARPFSAISRPEAAMFTLMPREKVFFDLIEQSAKNVHVGAEALATLLGDFTDVAAKVKRIKEIEHAGDEITHTIFDRLNRTFITPLDREDIHAIASRLDDILDLIDTAANRMMLYKVTAITQDAKELGECLVQATQAVVDAVCKMRDLKDPEGVLRLCVVIHTHENAGDRVAQRALAALFESYAPIDIIKWKDIYFDLETATDRCEDAANVLESIVLKNA
jgi:predicted phosphate transport protein (TIGR00153 family)